MQHWLVRGCVLILLGLAAAGGTGTGAHAAGIDCSKARSPTEKAICATPALLTLDRAIATAYADSLARQPGRRDALRQELIRWLKQRDAACALPAADIPECLRGQLTARLAALAPPAATPAPAAATAPTPEPAPAKLQTAAAPTAPPDPAIPSVPTPAAAASLDQASLPAAEQAETLLRVTSPGRFTITAHSPSGAALQLVDIMTGPGDLAGNAGSQDGRLDPLLDAGTYKLRVFSAPGAHGPVALTVTPFHDAAPPAALPQPGFPLTSTLRDGEQRAFWLSVPPGGAVRIEAAGRSLADLRLWRDGRELTALDPQSMRTEPATGHPLTDLRLTGAVEPGTYLAVAYGGAPLPWTDNDATQPFLLRAGASPALAEGWAGGPMGPFGSEVYALPAATGLLHLSLPAAAGAELLTSAATAAIARNSREPVANLAVEPGHDPVVEVRAAAGQAFTLQALEQPGTTSVTRPGTYWVSAVVNGAGGDEIPPGVLLERVESHDRPPRIVASTIPRIGPDAVWHAKFNLRGPTTLLFQNTAGGDLAVRSSGTSIGARARPGVADLPADYYELTLTPAAGAVGALDLVVGPPGPNPPAIEPLPANPVIPLGVQTVAPGQALRLSGPSAPGVTLGLSARRVPVALAEGPLTVTQMTGATVAVPVAVAPGGALSVSEVGGGPVAFGMQEGSTAVVPIASRTRTIVLAWRRAATTPAPIPTPPPADAATALQAGAPAFLDLARDETRGFALTVAQGGLYRVETLGRLHTTGRIATAFIPRLGEADGNGVGQNMLLQQVLRAGRYRVDVAAKESAGHLGLSVGPAPMPTGATLMPSGSVRAALAAGSAIIFPLTVTGPGTRYHLDVATLGAPWAGRIEDSEGWPVTRTAPLDGTEPTLPPGQYRLLVAPDAVARRVVARLTRVETPGEITGHGPHKLPFDAPQQATWREPDGRDQPRTPDAWSFALAGPAEVTLDLTDGMVADLHRDGVDQAITRVAGHYTGTLEAGRYRVDATSLGRNDRLAYTIGLHSPALQPGVPRSVELPASVDFAIAEPRVASLTSFGDVPVKAVLRRADGGVIGRYGARADDWNIAVSRLLPAGRYTLDLAATSPPDGNPVAQNTAPADQSPDQTDDSSDQKSGDDDQAAQTNGTQAVSAPSGDAPAADASPDDSQPDKSSPSTELRLALPESLPVAPAPASAATLAGDGVHVLALPQPAAGTLLVAQAASSAALTLALERQGPDGWHTVALDEGRSPVVASPADDAASAWRVEVWTVDGGSEPIQLAARAVAVAAQTPGQVSLAALDGMPEPLAVAHVGLDAASPVSVGRAPEGLLAGGWPGQALAALNGPLLPQGQDVWLLGRAPGTVDLARLALPDGQPVALSVPAAQVASLPAAAPADGHIALWRAEGGIAQPGLGAAAGIARGSAVALADKPVVLRNATGGDALRLVLTRLDLALAPPRALGAPLQTLLPPGTALPVTLPGGDKLLHLDLGAQVVAFAGGRAAGAVAAWSGADSLTRTLAGAWTDILLVNAGPAPAPVSLSWQPAPAAAALTPGAVVKRFFGAAGSFDLPFDAPAGTHLVTAGDARLVVVAADGTVARGQDVAVAGQGHAVVDHAAGAMAVWLAVDGVSPWPAAQPQPVQTPARLSLSGPAMALTLNQGALTLLHVSTTAPALLGVVQAGRTDAPRLFPAGAEFHGMLAAGPAEVRLYAPSDGPLSGTVTLASDPVTEIGEGLGDEVSVAPGGSAVFAFSLAKPATIGAGVRADPDTATVRLLDAAGTVLGEGVAQLRTLPAGRYLIEAKVPPDAATTILRPAVIGITPRGSGPPPDVVQHYLELVGLKPQGETR
jgi:uncharacterized protein